MNQERKRKSVQICELSFSCLHLPQGGRKPPPLLRRGLPRGHVLGPLKRTLSRDPPVPHLQELPPYRPRVEGHEEAPLQGLQKPGAVQASSPAKSSRRKALMAGVQRGLAPGGLPSSRPSIPLSGHRLRSRWRVVRSAWARRRTLKGTTGLVFGSRSRASSWTRALPVEPHRYHHRDQPHCLQAG